MAWADSTETLADIAPSRVLVCFNSCKPGNFRGFFCWFFLKQTFSKNSFRNTNHQSDNHVGSRSGPTFCRSWSGSELFARVINRWQKLPPARDEIFSLLTPFISSSNQTWVALGSKKSSLSHKTSHEMMVAVTSQDPDQPRNNAVLVVCSKGNQASFAQTVKTNISIGSEADFNLQ